MTTAPREKIIGASVDRVDGPLKVTGAAFYPSDFTYPDLRHAVLVQSTIAAGPVSQAGANAYSCPNVATHDRRARLHIPSPHWMRGPGTTQGNFAVESALDELSYTLGIDPIELRLRNYAEVHPGSGRPWSSKALRECYRVGAERFGWARRTPEIGSMRDGNWLVGYGMAGVTFTSGQAPCQART